MTKTNIVLNSIFALCLMTGMFLFFNDHIIGITRSSRLPFFNVTGFQQEYVLLNKKLSVDQIMLSLPGFREAVPNASLLIGDQVDFQTFEKAKKWKFDGSLYYKQLFNQTEDRCQKIKEHFVFLENPLSKEEADFPLAYGFLVYDNAIQIYFLLSAVYQPQNAYCIAVDSKSSDEFKKNLDLLGDCFPNIYVIQVNDVQWYKFSVVRGVWSCIRYLTNLDHAWKYYQYLSGVDLPLKTNLEMVRIFKQLNGTTNIDVNPIPSDRIRLVKNVRLILFNWYIGDEMNSNPRHFC